MADGSPRPTARLACQQQLGQLPRAQRRQQRLESIAVQDMQARVAQQAGHAVAAVRAPQHPQVWEGAAAGRRAQRAGRGGGRRGALPPLPAGRLRRGVGAGLVLPLVLLLLPPPRLLALALDPALSGLLRLLLGLQLLVGLPSRRRQVKMVPHRHPRQQAVVASATARCAAHVAAPACWVRGARGGSVGHGRDMHPPLSKKAPKPTPRPCPPYPRG